MDLRTVDSQIVRYLPLLGEAEKKSLLSIIETFVKLKQTNHGDRTSIEQYNIELDEALARIKSGEYYTQQEAEANINEWQSSYMQFDGTGKH